MPPVETLLTFLATTAMFSFLPGPAMLYVAARTMTGGRRSGLMAVLGIHLGGYAHIAAAAAGLTMLFHAVPSLYFAVKLGGAAYLVWLGLKLFRSRAGNSADASGPVPKSGGRAFLESMFVEVLNPKTALFFVAFLPQFVDPAASLPLWAQFVVLGFVVDLMFSLSDLTCVLLAALIMTRMKRSGSVQRLIQRTGGAILVGLGAHLALQRT